MDLGLRGKTVLVVASSQGLGKAIATEIVKEGANVMLTGRHEDKLAKVKDELLSISSGRVQYQAADITNKKEEIESVVAKTREVFGRLMR